MVAGLSIDNRECGILELLKDNDHVTIEQLDIGDIHIILDGVTKMIIERKALPDLVQSLKDGRYHEQKARLLSYRESFPDVKIMYIIEGQLLFGQPNMAQNFGTHVVNDAALISSFINPIIRDSIFMINTQNKAETVAIILAMRARYEKELVSKSYEECVINASVKTKKKDNIDPSMCLLMQIACVPGISAKKARIIVDALKIKNMKEMLAVPNLGNSLLEIHGMGKVMAKRIVEYITG